MFLREQGHEEVILGKMDLGDPAKPAHLIEQENSIRKLKQYVLFSPRTTCGNPAS